MGSNPILNLTRTFHDGDAWGTVMLALFGIADANYVHSGKCFPGYTPAPSLTIDNLDEFASEVLLMMYDGVTESEVQYAFDVLFRGIGILESLGYDY